MIKRLLFVLSALGTTPASSQTLGEAIERAYETNPQLIAARARQNALEEGPEQARAAGRFTSNSSWNGGYDRLGYGSSAAATVSANLPIWTGGRVRAAVRAADSDVAAGVEGVRDVEAQILEEVVSAYASLLYNQQAVDIARIGILRLDSQVAEARKRFDLGQATLTDVSQLEAQRSSVIANLAGAEGALAAAAASYRAAVGVDAGILAQEMPAAVALPETLAKARLRAESTNPVVRRQRRVADASFARVNQAKAEGAPALDLSGGYGRGTHLWSSEGTDFVAAASAGITLRVPLSTGGLVRSKVRQAEASAIAERTLVEAATREADRAVDSAWASLTAAQGRLQAATAGLAAADLALKGVRAEYGFGLRSTIDILVADQSYRSAQLSLAAAKSDVLTSQAALLRATGGLERSSFR